MNELRRSVRRRVPVINHLLGEQLIYEPSPTGGWVIKEVFRPPPPPSPRPKRKERSLIKIRCVIRLNDEKTHRNQLAAEFDLSLDLNKGSSDQPIDPDALPPVPKKRRGRPKKLTTTRSNECGTLSSLPPPDDSSTPIEPKDNQRTKIETDTKRIPLKKRWVRQKIALPAQVMLTNTSQPQEQDTTKISKEKIEVIKYSNPGTFPWVEESSVSKKSTTAVSEVQAVEPSSVKETSAKHFSIMEEEKPSNSMKDSIVDNLSLEGRTVEKPSINNPTLGRLPCIEEPSGPENSTTTDSKVVMVKEKKPDIEEPTIAMEISAQNSTIANKLTVIEEISSLTNPSVKEPFVKELSVEQPSIDDPSVEGPSVEVPSVEEPSMKDCHSNQNNKFNWKANTGALSVRIPGLRWDREEKRVLVAEAKKWGICSTARRYNMSSSTLHGWMMEDFCGDLAITNDEKMLNRGKSLRCDATIEVALKDWVIQKMVEKERISYKDLWTKAMELIIPSNPDFRATLGWIRRFLYRHKLNLRRMVHGKDAHSPRVKSFNSPSKKQTTPKSTPKSTEKATLLDKRKTTSFTPPPSKRKQLKKRTP